MAIILITGANKGLGYETARRLREAGHDIYMGARNRSVARPLPSPSGRIGF